MNIYTLDLYGLFNLESELEHSKNKDVSDEELFVPEVHLDTERSNNLKNKQTNMKMLVYLSIFTVPTIHLKI